MRIEKQRYYYLVDDFLYIKNVFLYIYSSFYKPGLTYRQEKPFSRQRRAAFEQSGKKPDLTLYIILVLDMEVKQEQRPRKTRTKRPYRKTLDLSSVSGWKAWNLDLFNVIFDPSRYTQLKSELSQNYTLPNRMQILINVQIISNITDRSIQSPSEDKQGVYKIFRNFHTVEIAYSSFDSTLFACVLPDNKITGTPDRVMARSDGGLNLVIDRKSDNTELFWFLQKSVIGFEVILL
jgi:hypothetical protein